MVRLGTRLAMAAAGAAVLGLAWGMYRHDPGALVFQVRHADQVIRAHGAGWVRHGQQAARGAIRGDS